VPAQEAGMAHVSKYLSLAAELGFENIEDRIIEPGIKPDVLRDDDTTKRWLDLTLLELLFFQLVELEDIQNHMNAWLEALDDKIDTLIDLTDISNDWLEIIAESVGAP
jgi:hypothetical protein